MDVEKEIVSYLYEYGNTKEDDIINYCVRNFGISSEDAKKVIKRMVIKGDVHFIIHSRLKPPEVYISLEESSPPDVMKLLLEAFIQVKTAEEDTQKILEEAEAIAKKKIKEKHASS